MTKNYFLNTTRLRHWWNDSRFPISNKGIFVLGDLRKFTEQYGNIVQWDQSNRAYIMTHGVMGSIEGTLSTRCRKTCKTFIWTTWKAFLLLLDSHCQILNCKFLELTPIWYYGGPYTNPVPRALLFALLQELPQTTRSRRRWGDTPHRKDCRSRRQW